jgi:hypothetical protein
MTSVFMESRRLDRFDGALVVCKCRGGASNNLFVILRSKTGQKETLYHSQPVPRMQMHQICLPRKLERFCLHAIVITFLAVPRSFGSILTFFVSPDLRLEPGGVLVYRPVVPGFPQPLLITIAWNNFPRLIVSLSSLD